ncbi:MAG TPA: chaperone modulator CbpM [Steroidobacteraceae bacterium]|nr:chaperone modulator CbpM [Steroidobacteraceae bacterium]
MRIEITELNWPERQELSFSELLELSGLTQAELNELVSGGAIAALDTDAAASAFTSRYNALALLRARTARRLRDDFDLNTSGLALALTLLERIEQLEQQAGALRARLTRW